MRRLLLLAALCLFAAGSALSAPPSATPSPSPSPDATDLPWVVVAPPATFVIQPSAGNRLVIDAPDPSPTPPPPPTVEQAQAWALSVLGPQEYGCLWWIVWNESKWDPTVWNHQGSGAYGLPQAKPGVRMAAAGADWETNPITQLRWAIDYGTAKYGSMCGSLWFWNENGWW